MKWLQEFKAFAVRGNVVDMAVGIVIGAAVRQNRVFVCRGRDYAADWSAHRGHRFQ